MAYDPLFKTFTAPAATITCYKCAIPFAVPDEWRTARLKDREDFWCPNGHRQAYVGKTETQKVREQLEHETRRRESAESRLVVARRQVSARQGQITKLRKKLTPQPETHE